MTAKLVSRAVLAVCICSAPVATATRAVSAADSTVSAGATWLVGQMHPETHLLRSYDNPAEFNAWTYDQAVAAMALLEAGRYAEAALLLDTMLATLSEGEDRTGMVAFADGYDWVDASEIQGAETRATGPNAWMGLAFLHGYLVLGDSRYLSRAEHIASWLMDTLRADGDPSGSDACVFLGGIVPGDTKPFQWISTEHNADMLAFLRRLQLASTDVESRIQWADCADSLESWMLKTTAEGGLWVEGAPGHFAVGYESVDPPVVSSFEEVVDSQTWTVLALKASGKVTGNPLRGDRIGLDWLDGSWLVAVECEGESRLGFGKRTFTPGDPTSPLQSYWTEGMGGYAMARLVAGTPSPAGLTRGKVVNDIRCFQKTDGGVLYTVGDTIDLSDYFEEGEAPLAVFSNFNNLFGGEPGVYGDAEPDWANRPTHLVSWFYSQSELGDVFNPDFIRSPVQSFLLINDADRSGRGYPSHPGGGGWNGSFTAWNPHGWASFTLGLTPVDQPSTDLSSYSVLSFWARSEFPGVQIRVIGHLEGEVHDRVWPPRGVSPLAVPSDGWMRFDVPLDALFGADRTEAESVGISFGSNEGNADQATLWVEDFSFSPTGDPIPELKEWPTNWAWESVAATSWLIFAERRFNPFALEKARRPGCGRGASGSAAAALAGALVVRLTRRRRRLGIGRSRPV